MRIIACPIKSFGPTLVLPMLGSELGLLTLVYRRNYSTKPGFFRLFFVSMNVASGVHLGWESPGTL